MLSTAHAGALRIAIVVQGRFHAFDLARELLARGHDVVVFTNYPRWAVARFGIPPSRARTFVWHGVLSRIVGRVPGRSLARLAEPALHRMFGRWAERALRGRYWDVVHCFSGVFEETLTSPAVKTGARVLVRASSHIEVQSGLLEAEEARVGVPIDRPSGWMRARELREYTLADRIVVLSTFSRNSFTAQDVPAARLRILSPGVRVDVFRPAPDVVDARMRRIRAGAPLRILYVGAVSYRKGMLDLVRAMQTVAEDAFHFTLVGEPLDETRHLMSGLPRSVEVVGKLPQNLLPQRYWDADIFIFPTIEDGFPYVLAQAQAAALPIITTAHGAGLDIVTPDRDGWIVPVRDPQAIAERLEWCASNRSLVASMVSRIYESFRSRSWADMAADFEAICSER